MGKLASSRTPPNMSFAGNGPGDYHDHVHEHDNGLNWRDHSHMHMDAHHHAFTKSQRYARAYGASDRRLNASFQTINAALLRAGDGQAIFHLDTIARALKTERYARTYGASEETVTKLKVEKAIDSYRQHGGEVESVTGRLSGREDVTKPLRAIEVLGSGRFAQAGVDFVEGVEKSLRATGAPVHRHEHRHQAHDQYHHMSSFLGFHTHQHKDSFGDPFVRHHMDKHLPGLGAAKELQVKPFCCDAAARESMNRPPKIQHHLHRHRHPGEAVEEHTHDHSCGHHKGERGLAGQIVSSRFTGQLAHPTMMDALWAKAERSRVKAQNFRILYEGVPTEMRRAAPSRYSGKGTDSRTRPSYDDETLRRFVVYYTDDDLPNKGPIHLVGRRAPRPDYVIETALALLKNRGIDPTVKAVHVFLVDTGKDQGYGQMIDIKMHNVEVTTSHKWELTPFTSI